MSAHTPGPWFAVNATDVFTGLGASTRDGVSADTNDGWRIADCDVAVAFVDGVEMEMGFSEKLANARLIAAAPDLLAALVNFTEEFCRSANSGDWGFWDPEEQEEVIRARAAIAKATKP